MKENRGRKLIYNENLTERITFLVTKEQLNKLKKEIEDINPFMSLSDFIRNKLFKKGVD